MPSDPGPLHALTGALLLAAALAAPPASAGAQPPARSAAPGAAHAAELRDAVPEPLVFDGAVLVGVDVYGRVLVALDEHGDGRGDRFYLFRTLAPYQAPWSRLLERATLIETDEGVVIFTSDHVFGVTLSLETGAAPLPPGRYREAHSYGDGVELSVATPEEGFPGTSLTELSFSDPATWPQSFWPAELSPTGRD